MVSDHDGDLVSSFRDARPRIETQKVASYV